MASLAAVTAASAAEGGSLQSDSVRIVDLHLLSQSELYSLSLCSPPPSFCDDVVIPKIDRSVFNESAGSRKQTYSRLRLAPPSSSPTAPRRRTPHLRPTATISKNNSSDPENAENAHIVALLKQMFMPNMDPGELVPVKIDYSHSVLPQQLKSNVSPVAPVKMNYSYSLLPQQLVSNVSSTGQKRKRGRPRKDEVLRKEEERESMNDDVSLVEVKDNVANKIFVSENVEDMDKELLNRDGVAVDLVKLGAVEHPFRDEIRRRSEGLGTEDELLGFLNNLNGQWGSRRKKKRIVNASEFGNALPIGWKLLLSVKKKTGVVWLFCRRYISPGGRQFVSCKEVSSYLLSLHGLQDLNPHVQVQNEDAVESTPVTEILQTADPATQNDARKETPASNVSSPALASTFSNLITKAVDLSEGRGRENLRCKKCNVSFSDRVELLQHQSSFHPKTRFKNSVSLADGVIMKDGKYECQFCHKTFNERHRYTGHIGAHVRYREKMAGEVPRDGMGESVDPISCSDFPVQATMVESENVLVTVNNGLDSSSPCNKDNAHVEDSEEANVNIGGANEATDVVTAKSPISVDVAFISSNKNKDSHEASDHAPVNDSAPEMVEDGSILQERSGNCSPLPFYEKTDGVTEISVSMEKPKQDLVSENNLVDSNNYVEAYDTGVNNGEVCQTSNELKLDDDNFAVKEAIFNLFESHNGHDKETAVSVEQQSSFEDLPCKNINNTDGSFISASTLPKCSDLKSVFNISMPAPSNDEKSCGEENVCLPNKGTDYETHNVRTHENRSSEGDYVAESRRHEEMKFGISSFIPSMNEQKTLSEKYSSESMLNEPCVQNNSDRRLVASHESKEAVNDNDNICGRETEVPQLDDIQNIRNAELSDTFGGSYSALNSDSMIEKEYSREDNVFNLFSSALEDQNQKPSGGVLFGQSGVSEVSNAGYTGNEIYPTPMTQAKLDEYESPRKHELSLSFGNYQKELQTDSDRAEQERYPTENFKFQSIAPQNYGDQTHSNVPNANRAGDVLSFINVQKEHQADSNRSEQERYSTQSFNFQSIVPQNYSDQTRSDIVSASRPNVLSFVDVQKELQTNSDRGEQEKYPAEGFNFQSTVPQNYGDQSRSSVVNTNIHSGVKQARGFGFDFLDSSFNRPHEFPSSLNMSANEGGWNASSGVKVGTSDQNMMHGFERSSSQSVDGLGNGSWPTGNGNVFEDPFGIASTPQVQATTGFVNFDRTQNKAQEASYGINERYDVRTNSYGAGRSEPVEYSFMGGQGSNSIPGDSKIFSYNANAGPGLDSSFWLGKDALMHSSIPPRNQVMDVCAWCGNGFFQDSVQSGVQTGAIGSMCPSCSAKFPGHYNVL